MILLMLLAKMIACSGILYGYYWLFLRNKRFHHYNRFYLLAATVVSVALPFIRIPVFLEPDTPTGNLLNRSIDIMSVSRWEEEFSAVPEGRAASWFTLQNTLLVFYVIVIMILLSLLLRSLFYIWRISGKYPYKYINALKFYNTTEPGTPFSFFRSIYWNSRLDFNSKEGQQIFRHELFHVNQKHSADILFLELAGIFFWINPFFHLIKRETKAIHEFLADQHAISDTNHFEYAELLVLQSIITKKNHVSNYFFQNHIKRRIAMITQFKNEKYSYWTRLMVLPLSIVLFCAIALYGQSSNVSHSRKVSFSPPLSTSAPITVLVDAGHGGEDAGAKSDKGLLEKDFALAIAKQIKKHAGAFNIKVVMTREEDSYPKLKERTDLAKSVKADMIVSVHVAATEKPTTKSGFDIYITNRNMQTIEQSKIFGQIIADRIEKLYQVGPLKQRKESGIWILDAVYCPAVLIECGYITNEKDVAFISAPENQEQIARSILAGIAEYQSGKRVKSIPDSLAPKKVLADTVNIPLTDTITRGRSERKPLQPNNAGTNQ